MDNIISSKEARAQFADLLNQVVYAGREFIISRFDKPVAKISPINIKNGSDDLEVIRRRKVISKIKVMRSVYRNIDLTNLVIAERDKEYRKWKK